MFGRFVPKAACPPKSPTCWPYLTLLYTSLLHAPLTLLLHILAGIHYTVCMPYDACSSLGVMQHSEHPAQCGCYAVQVCAGAQVTPVRVVVNRSPILPRIRTTHGCVEQWHCSSCARIEARRMQQHALFTMHYSWYPAPARHAAPIMSVIHLLVFPAACSSHYTSPYSSPWHASLDVSPGMLFHIPVLPLALGARFLVAGASYLCGEMARQNSCWP